MKDLKFIHITKTAGTSIEDEGNRSNILWGRFHHEYGWWHGYFPHKPSWLKQKYNWFTVVRDPYTRIVSEFYCRYSGVMKSNRYTRDKNKFNEIIRNKVLHSSKHHGNHWSEQYKYIDNQYNIEILKYENLPECFDNLMQKYNLPIKLTLQSNKSNKKIFDVKDLYRETIDAINEVYDQDFVLFNYTKK